MVQFDNGIPTFEGTWVNTRTGDVFTAKDTLFEDGQLIVLTTDGRRLGYHQLEHYMRDDTAAKKGEKPQVPVRNQQRIVKEEPATYRDMLEDVNDYTINPAPVSKPKQSSKSETDIIIERAFSNIQLPDINISLKWSKANTEKIQSVCNLMGIDAEAVAKYLNAKLFDKLNDALAVAVRNKLNIKDGGDAAPVLGGD